MSSPLGRGFNSEDSFNLRDGEFTAPFRGPIQRAKTSRKPKEEDEWPSGLCRELVTAWSGVRFLGSDRRSLKGYFFTVE